MSRRGTAYHEAGHAVAAHRQGKAVATVTIKPNPEDKTLGVSDSEEFEGGEEDTIVGLYAGLAAQRLVHPEAQPEHGAWDDYEKAARFHGEDEPPPELEKRAADLVAENRQAIDALAQALLEHETIPGQELGIIIDAVDEGEDWSLALRAYRKLWAGEGLTVEEYKALTGRGPLLF